MRRLPLLLVALLAVASLAASAPDGGGDPTVYTAPYPQGPSGGDEYNYMRADEDGRITVGRAYPVVSVISCDALAGYTLYELEHHAATAIPHVTVDYAEAALDPYTFLTVYVKDADGEFLGAYHQRGPLTGEGALEVPLTWDDEFEPQDIRIQFGLELTSACPSADAGTVRFAAVNVHD